MATRITSPFLFGGANVNMPTRVGGVSGNSSLVRITSLDGGCGVALARFGSCCSAAAELTATLSTTAATAIAIRLTATGRLIARIIHRNDRIGTQDGPEGPSLRLFI